MQLYAKVRHRNYTGFPQWLSHVFPCTMREHNCVICSLALFIKRLFVNTSLVMLLLILGAEEKTNVELIVPIGSVVIAMFFWLLVVFVIRGRKKVRGSSSSSFLCHTFPSLDFPTSYAQGT